MNAFEFSPAQIEHFMFVLFRVGAILMFMPVLGSGLIPARIRVAFALLFSFAIFPLVQYRGYPQVDSLLELSSYLFIEITVGFAIAYTVRLIFTAVQLAGTVVDFQMGFGVVNVIDPQTNSQVSITAQFQNILAILLFLALDTHHFIIHAMVESFSMIDPQSYSFSSLSVEYILRLFSATFATAAKIAAPLMAILFFLSVGLGLVARTVPQMNVFIVGFPLQIGVGLLMTGFSMAFFSQIVSREMESLPERIFSLMNTF